MMIYGEGWDVCEWPLWRKAYCGLAVVTLRMLEAFFTAVWHISGHRWSLAYSRPRWLWYNCYLKVASYAYPWGIWRETRFGGQGEKR